jgi:hypothetical protein
MTTCARATIPAYVTVLFDSLNWKPMPAWSGHHRVTYMGCLPPSRPGEVDRIEARNLAGCTAKARRQQGGQGPRNPAREILAPPTQQEGIGEMKQVCGDWAITHRPADSRRAPRRIDGARRVRLDARVLQARIGGFHGCCPTSLQTSRVPRAQATCKT